MYNKLFTSILDSSIWLESTTTRLVWITLLAAMDEDGFVRMATVENLANRARVTLKEAEAAAKALESPDRNCPEQEREGRRIERVDGGWMVLNSKKYRDIVNKEKLKEQTRLRVARHRAKAGGNAPVTAGNENVTPSEADSEAEANKGRERVTGKRPTLEQAKTKAQMTGQLEDQAELFWNHFEASGWIDKNGHPVLNWEAKMATWMANARARPAEQAHHNGKAAQTGISASTQVILDTNKLERIEKRILDIRNSVEGHQTMDEVDRDELRDLKKQCKELKRNLGITV